MPMLVVAVTVVMPAKRISVTKITKTIRCILIVTFASLSRYCVQSAFPCVGFGEII